MDSTINSKLAEIVGKNDIATDIYERRLYSHDATPLLCLISSLFQTIPVLIGIMRINALTFHLPANGNIERYHQN